VTERRLKTYVVALGGNAILKAGQKGAVEEQLHNLNQTGRQLLDLLGGHNRVVITHGNGPQVGNLLLALEEAKEVPSMSLDVCVAATQGFMGYMIQQAVANCLRKNGFAHNISTVICQVIVDENDPAFRNPTKPIGPFYTVEEAIHLERGRGWQLIKDATCGCRRVVASPEPLEIQQARIIRSMLDAGEIVIAAGGGGIPVIRNPDNSLRGVEAVIDKDLASARLGIDIDADVLLILTAVENVFVDFGRPSQRPLHLITVTEAEALLEGGQFGSGSMEPKIRASIKFLKGTPKKYDREVIITVPGRAMEALIGKAGTRIVLETNRGDGDVLDHVDYPRVG
jgi:carbamate kinase